MPTARIPEPLSDGLECIYVYHLFGLAVTALTTLDEVFEAVRMKRETGGSYVAFDALLLAKIEFVLMQSANIAKVLRIPGTRSKGKAPPEFPWRMTRTRALNELLGNPELTQLRQTETRNALEHFDAYLDRMIVAERSNPEGARAAAYNLSISHPGAIAPPARALRLLIADEQTYYCMGEATPLRPLHDDLKLIVERLRPILGPRDTAIGVLAGFDYTKGPRTR